MSSSSSTNYTQLGLEAAKIVAKTYQPEITQAATDATNYVVKRSGLASLAVYSETTVLAQEFSGLASLAVYSETTVLAQEFNRNNRERGALIGQINPLNYIVNPIVDLATDYVAMPALKVSYICAASLTTVVVGCFSQEKGQKLADSIFDPVSTETLLSIIDRIQRLSCVWSKRQPSNRFLIAYPDTCSIVAARSINTFANDTRVILRMPIKLREIIDEVSDAAIEEIVRPLTQDGIDYGRSLVKAAAEAPKAVPQITESPTYWSRINAAAGSAVYSAGSMVISKVKTASGYNVNEVPPKEVVVEQPVSTSYWSRISTAAGYVASGARAVVTVTKKVKVVAGFAVAGLSWIGGAVAEGAVNIISSKLKHEVSLKEKEVRQKIVGTAVHALCRQVVSSSIHGMVKGAVVYGCYSVTEHVIYTGMAYDGERSMELCRNIAQTTSLCITVTGAVLWVKCLTPTAQRLYNSYSKNYNPNTSLFTDMAGLMDQRYVSAIVNQVSEALQDKGCENTRVGNFARRVAGIKMENPFEPNENQ